MKFFVADEPTFLPSTYIIARHVVLCKVGTFRRHDSVDSPRSGVEIVALLHKVAHRVEVGLGCKAEQVGRALHGTTEVERCDALRSLCNLHLNRHEQFA